MTDDDLAPVPMRTMSESAWLDLPESERMYYGRPYVRITENLYAPVHLTATEEPTHESTE